jgi:hypothetical protein
MILEKASREGYERRTTLEGTGESGKKFDIILK